MESHFVHKTVFQESYWFILVIWLGAVQSGGTAKRHVPIYSTSTWIICEAYSCHQEIVMRRYGERCHRKALKAIDSIWFWNIRRSRGREVFVNTRRNRETLVTHRWWYFEIYRQFRSSTWIIYCPRKLQIYHATKVRQHEVLIFRKKWWT